jgi:hypothetical protein
MPNCKPGDLCMIVAFYPRHGSVRNIGTVVRVHSPTPTQHPKAPNVTFWLFTEASRLVGFKDPHGRSYWVRDSFSPPDASYVYYALADHHLVPIKPVDEPKEVVRNIHTGRPIHGGYPNKENA